MNSLIKDIVGNVKREEKIHMKREEFESQKSELHGVGHRPHIPPHERKNMIYVEFDESSEDALKNMFGSKEDAEIAINILHCAPPEQQVIALQLLRMNGIRVKARFPEIHSIPVRWAAPTLGEDVYDEYEEVYGEDGTHYVQVLESSPYEISVISRIIAYMQGERGK